MNELPEENRVLELSHPSLIDQLAQHQTGSDVIDSVNSSWCCLSSTRRLFTKKLWMFALRRAAELLVQVLSHLVGLWAEPPGTSAQLHVQNVIYTSFKCNFTKFCTSSIHLLYSAGWSPKSWEKSFTAASRCHRGGGDVRQETGKEEKHKSLTLWLLT